ncbi:MAG: hypothetical protein KGL35_00275 [Bradyrhizobium sp.]|nr:hypothetical protein [Bradyrhizobium sp.]
MSIASVKSCCDQNGNKSSEEVTLQAVYGPEGSPNAQWSKWTPCANLSMTINNPAAFGKVLPGQFFFVDLIPTDKDGI